MLRQSIVEDVLIADPILNAVHSGANATATERYTSQGQFATISMLTGFPELYIL
jgi:hypothetical protein